MTTAQVLMKVSTMKLIFDPSWIDGCPGCPGPVFNSAIGDYAVAGLLKQIAGKLSDRNISERLLNVSRSMAENSSRGLINGWEEGDDLCPPWWPHHHINVGPQPEPWKFQGDFSIANYSGVSESIAVGKFSPAASELMLAGAIKQLASLTSNAEHSKEMFGIGQSIVKGASARIYDEYCGTVPRPRPHFFTGREAFAKMQ